MVKVLKDFSRDISNRITSNERLGISEPFLSAFFTFTFTNNIIYVMLYAKAFYDRVIL